MLLDKDQQLENALQRVSDLEEDYRKAITEHFAAKAELKIAEAEEYLIASGTIQFRENTAIKNTAEQVRNAYKKEAVYLFTKEKLKDAQDAVSARQSLLSAEVKTNQRL